MDDDIARTAACTAMTGEYNTTTRGRGLGMYLDTHVPVVGGGGVDGGSVATAVAAIRIIYLQH